MRKIRGGLAFSVMGNHDDRLRRWLRGNKVHIAHGLETTIAEFRQESGEFRARVEDFLSGFPSHLILDGGQLIVAHAGMRREFIGDPHPRVMRYCMYGETTGEVDHYGRPIRLPWAQDYTGRAFVAYGHNPVESPSWTDRTVNLDTGCVFGGYLSVLRWPEKEIEQVRALKTYCPRAGWKETF